MQGFGRSVSIPVAGCGRGYRPPRLDHDPLRGFQHPDIRIIEDVVNPVGKRNDRQDDDGVADVGIDYDDGLAGFGDRHEEARAEAVRLRHHLDGLIGQGALRNSSIQAKPSRRSDGLRPLKASIRGTVARGEQFASPI